MDEPVYYRREGSVSGDGSWVIENVGNGGIGGTMPSETQYRRIELWGDKGFLLPLADGLPNGVELRYSGNCWRAINGSWEHVPTPTETS